MCIRCFLHQIKESIISKNWLITERENVTVQLGLSNVENPVEIIEQKEQVSKIKELVLWQMLPEQESGKKNLSVFFRWFRGRNPYKGGRL